ncbi:MAG: hypothetical protein PHE48_02410 [Candidatus Daviesbacteria bacterium]|nr:hypothetical protein [Candidatus Daviesbacteria bacterium]
MLKGGPEIEKGASITVETVLQSIEQTESWWGQLQALMQQGKPVKGFISDVIEVWSQLEIAAQNLQSQLPQNPAEAAKIKALWIISAPGTYFQASKQDRYVSKPWSRWMDRQRINYALQIGRKLAEMKLGHPISNNWADAERELTEQGPLVVYNGTPAENAAVLEAKKAPWFRIPEANIYPGNKILVISPIADIDNTVDQIKSFHLPPVFDINLRDEIGVVLHAPQAVRFLYMLANFQETVPEGANMRVFALPTPEGGFPEYPMQELRGTTYYRFIANPPIAAESPYPFKNLSS